jgi:sugar phosphate isomerase/epimerase
MKLSMMTLGCPDWDLQTICRRAREYGYDGVDFRGIQSELDVTRLPAFTSAVKQTVKLLADHGLVASGISSSIRVCDGSRRSASLDEARRTLDSAVAVGAKHVRIFGEGDPDKIGYAESAKIGRDVLNEILNIPGAEQVSWNFETHDHWIQSGQCKLLLDAITDPAFGVAWDLGHTRRIGGETAEQSYSALGKRVRYVHIKDAVRAEGHPLVMKDGWRYVLPGLGELELDLGIGVLKRNGYDGWVMFEHEKRWHPELEEPEIAMPAFVKWARQTIAEAPGPVLKV